MRNKSNIILREITKCDCKINFNDPQGDFNVKNCTTVKLLLNYRILGHYPSYKLLLNKQVNPSVLFDSNTSHSYSIFNVRKYYAAIVSNFSR